MYRRLFASVNLFHARHVREKNLGSYIVEQLLRNCPSSGSDFRLLVSKKTLCLMLTDGTMKMCFRRAFLWGTSLGTCFAWVQFPKTSMSWGSVMQLRVREIWHNQMKNNRIWISGKHENWSPPYCADTKTRYTKKCTNLRTGVRALDELFWPVNFRAHLAWEGLTETNRRRYTCQQQGTQSVLHCS